MSYRDGFVPLPERIPLPRAHTVHTMHPISWCEGCGTPVLFACDFRTRSKHEGRKVRTFCVHTETVKRHRCGFDA